MTRMCNRGIGTPQVRRETNGKGRVEPYPSLPNPAGSEYGEHVEVAGSFFATYEWTEQYLDGMLQLPPFQKL